MITNSSGVSTCNRPKVELRPTGSIVCGYLTLIQWCISINYNIEVGSLI